MGVGKARIAPMVIVVHPLDDEDEPTREAEYDRAMAHAQPLLDQIDRITILEMHQGGHIRLAGPTAHEFSCWCGSAHGKWPVI